MLLRREFLAAILLASAAHTVPAQETFKGVQRIVAIGDVHGDYDQFITVLRAAALIDGNNKWAGGKTHLVQTGDVLDRGPDSRKVMDLLMELEKQAKKAGGAVHSLLGNHEAMNIYGDLRYVSPEEFASYRSPKSEELRDKLYGITLDDLKNKGAPPPDEAFRKKFDAEHPLGWVEHRLAFAAKGTYGKWLLQHKAIVKINDVIFLHGGISPKYATTTIKEFNQKTKEELEDFNKLENGVAMDQEGPLWYRGLAQGDEAGLSAHVDLVLKTQEASRIVIGHTPRPAVLSRFGGKVITIDVGLSKVFGGPPAFLLIEGPKYYAVHRGRPLELPVAGADPLPYLKAVAALDPQPSPIQLLIEGKSVAESEPRR
jgi:hypothetical protein